MATQQQAMIVETVLAFKKVLKRKAYDSDSDSSIEHNTNRGNKLKKRSRFVKQGRLAPPNGPAAYKEVAEHAGFRRAIISRNPPLIDEEGYDIDSDDDEERVQAAIADAEEENPYSSIHLENLLAPLTAVTDLPTHPTLSRPFTSKALTELVQQCCSLMHKENTGLWKVKPLLTRLIGDNTWVPCGMMIEPNDLELFTNPARFIKRPTGPQIPAAAATGRTKEVCAKQNPGKTSSGGGFSEPGQPEGAGAPQQDGGAGKEMETVDGQEESGARLRANGQTEGDTSTSSATQADQVNGIPQPPSKHESATNGEPRTEGNSFKTNGGAQKDVEMMDAQGSEGVPIASAQNGDTRAAPAEEAVEDLFIHPYFLAPRSAHPDRDMALPEAEAEDLRRLLQLYVQKQEEVCRGTKKLYEGLLKADRLRRTVLQWSKAEAHCGPNRDMSDGEDWYDKEEWGLTEDLKKGEDEVEEDTTQTQKKTRNRK